MRCPVVGVLGSGAEPWLARSAPLGRWLARRGVHLLTGGGAGVMAAVSAAFAGEPDRPGLCLGVLPGDERGLAPAGYPNAHVELALRTHLPLSGARGTDRRSRNHLNVLTSDVLVALPGGAGTTSEVALAAHYGRPLIGWWVAHDEIADVPSDTPRAADLNEVCAFLDRHLADGTYGTRSFS